MKIVIAAVLVFLSLLPAGMAGPKPSGGYSKRIIGRWLGSRKFEIYYADGTWAVQRNEESKPDKEGRRWHIEDDKLTLTFPGGSTTETIVSMSHARFVTKDDGSEEVRTRAGK